MKNAHLRFGWLTYLKMTEKTTTTFKLRVDRFIGEVLPQPPRQARAHLISVIGSDTQIAAVGAAISLGERFMVEGPGVPPVRVCPEQNAQCYKGSLQLSDRKKPLRHLVGISEELASAGAFGGRESILLADSSATFVWTSMAHVHGLPGIPEWGDWFQTELGRHKAIIPLLGIGCDPVRIRGNKTQFLSWMSRAVQNGTLDFPATTGPTQWPQLGLSQALA